MNKREFKDLLLYIKTHPSDAQLLSAALEQTNDENKGIRSRLSNESVSTLYGETPGEGHAVDQPGAPGWLDADEVGRGVGRSGKWVKEHRQLLPTAFCRKSECGHRAWLFSPASINLLSQYR